MNAVLKPETASSLSPKRHPFAQYFVDIWAGISTTYIGMKLTLTYLFSKPFTMRYPEVRPVIPPGHRGLHEYDEKKCISCRMCERSCPVDCITVELLGKGKDALVTRFDIDYSKCLFCNLCAETCPTSCVWLSEKYNFAHGTREGCVMHLAPPKSDAEIAAFKEALAKKEAEKRAADAAKAAEAAAKAAEASKAADGAPKDPEKTP